MTVPLPTAEVRKGRVCTVKDESGAAATNNITLATEGSETIDGSAADGQHRHREPTTTTQRLTKQPTAAEAQTPSSWTTSVTPTTTQTWTFLPVPTA